MAGAPAVCSRAHRAAWAFRGAQTAERGGEASAGMFWGPGRLPVTAAHTAAWRGGIHCDVSGGRATCFPPGLDEGGEEDRSQGCLRLPVGAPGDGGVI